MSFIGKLEYKYGKYAIPNLNIYICIVHIIGLLIQMTSPFFYYRYLSLRSMYLMSGQIWRIFTFLFYPPSGGSFVLISALIIYVYYSLSTSLIYVWGSFKFNLYFLIGILGHVLACVILGLLKIDTIISPSYLMFSIFIAYSFTFGDSLFLLFFFIPIKAKYLALFEIALYIYMFIGSGFATRISIVASLLNLIIFFYLLYKDKYGKFSNFLLSIKVEANKLVNDIKRLFTGRR